MKKTLHCWLELTRYSIGIAVVSLALQLAGGFIKLYDFWGTVQDAPHEVQEVLIDLKLLSKILDVLVKRNDSSPHVKDVLEHCDTKVEVRYLDCVGEHQLMVSRCF